MNIFSAFPTILSINAIGNECFCAYISITNCKKNLKFRRTRHEEENYYG